MNLHSLRAAMVAGALVCGAPVHAGEISREQIQIGYQEHAAMAQFLRWFQLYERPDGGIENALDILSDEIVISSGLGTANGHDDYAQRVQQLPDTWKNAHFVNSTQLDLNENGGGVLTAKVTYQNQGILEDGGIREADLSYRITFVPEEGTVLPKLASVQIAQDSDGVTDSWSDAYPENRARSLVHYYLSIIEDPARDPAPTKELFADEFSLNFSSGAITDYEGFQAWLAGPASQVTASTHVIEDFSVEEADDGTWQVSMDFDWAGLLPNGQELVAKTRHKWIVTNDVTERFARIKQMDVEILEPFRPKDT